MSDAQIKSLIDKGLGCDVKRADPILPHQKKTIWVKGVFGQKHGEQLQLTMFFYARILFGLNGCDEHHSLKAEQCFIGTNECGNYIRGLGQFNVQNK